MFSREKENYPYIQMIDYIISLKYVYGNGVEFGLDYVYKIWAIGLFWFLAYMLINDFVSTKSLKYRRLLH